MSQGKVSSQDYTALRSGVDVVTRVLMRGRQRLDSLVGDVTMETIERNDGRKGPCIKECMWLLEVGKARKQNRS